jgi:uncharacterized cupin superfamily protein
MSDDGWYVVNATEATWHAAPGWGQYTAFEREGVRFPQFGINIRVLDPGDVSTRYHAEDGQEDFLVLTGECTLLVEGEERPLRVWDFVHCPPGTAHAFVGSGDGPCVILMVGARTTVKQTVYPDSELARSHGAGAEAETSSARDAYAPFGHWRRRRSGSWANLPWA